MPATIDLVTGIGGNPPTSIRVSGTVSGCEFLSIESSCTAPPRRAVPITQNTWGPIDLPNDSNCKCGTPITITLYCQVRSGEPEHKITDRTFTLICEDCCPDLDLDKPRVSGCAPTNAVAQFNATLWQQTYTQDHPYAPTPITRQWVIWHLIEHDLHHGGEISLTLGMYGLVAPEI